MNIAEQIACFPGMLTWIHINNYDIQQVRSFTVSLSLHKRAIIHICIEKSSLGIVEYVLEMQNSDLLAKDTYTFSESTYERPKMPEKGIFYDLT